MTADDPFRPHFDRTLQEVLEQFAPGRWITEGQLKTWGDRLLDVLAEYGDFD